MLQFYFMKQIIFSTGNNEKFLTAQHACKNYGIDLVQNSMNIVEIQGEEPEIIAKDKAAKAYAIAKEPVVITDDSWAFCGLGGFPGAYMHSINEWFTPEDFLRLTAPLKDRKVILTQCLVYDNGQQQKTFLQETEGKLLKEVRGQSSHPSHTVITLDGDKGLSIAEAYEEAVDKSTRKTAQVWQDFARWLNENK